MYFQKNNEILKKINEIKIIEEKIYRKYLIYETNILFLIFWSDKIFWCAIFNGTFTPGEANK